MGEFLRLLGYGILGAVALVAGLMLVVVLSGLIVYNLPSVLR